MKFAVIINLRVSKETIFNTLENRERQTSIRDDKNAGKRVAAITIAKPLFDTSSVLWLPWM